MSRISDGHFSESVTFEADGLDDILKKVREARNETDLYHAAGLRASSLFGRSGGLAASLAGGFGGTGGSATYRPRPSLASPFPSTAGLSATAATMAEANYVERANRAARMGQPIPLASGAGSQTYGLQTDTISDQAHRRRRQMDADRLVRDQQPPGPPPLPAQGVASWERFKRNAQGYREEVARVVAEYDKLQKRMTTRAGNWFHGDPMTRALRENAQKARRDLDAAEQARRRAIGFRGRFGEDWHGQDGRGGYAGGLRTAGNIALGAGVGVFGLGMAGLQGTVTGNRFNNEWERTVRELGNSFGPALREATHWLEKFNQWLSKLSPSGQRMIAAGGIAAAGYAGARALGLGGAIHGAAGAIGSAAFSGAAAYGPGALRALGGGSMLAGAGVAGVAAYGAYGAITRNMDSRAAADLSTRVLAGKADSREAEGLELELKLAKERHGGKDKFLEEFERRNAEFNRRTGQGRERDNLGTWGKFKAGINNAGLDLGLAGNLKAEQDWINKNQALVAAQREIDANGKIRVGGGRNVEPLAGGGFESLMQTYQRIETAFGKIDKGKPEDKQLKAAELFDGAVKMLVDAMQKIAGNAAVPGMAGGAVAAGGAEMMAGKVT